MLRKTKKASFFSGGLKENIVKKRFLQKRKKIITCFSGGPKGNID